jgi:hypothetical protein
MQHFRPQKLRRIVDLRKYFFLRVQAANPVVVGIRINGSEFRIITARFAVIIYDRGRETLSLVY